MSRISLSAPDAKFKSQGRVSFARSSIICLRLAVLFIVLFCLFSCRQKHAVKVTPQMDIGEEFWIRVLLFDDVSELKLRIDSSFSILQSETAAASQRFIRLNSAADVYLTDGKITIGEKTFNINQLTILPDSPHIFNLNGSDYRGKLTLLINADGKSFDAVNSVPIEAYLAGVIGAEMPDYWEPAALQAQAIAARTYCLYIKRRFGSARAWDVTKTQANQVYLGFAAESKQVWDAIDKTKGQVLICNYPDGSKDIFCSYYSSMCGGHTEDSQNVFGGEKLEPLSGVRCPYCQYVARPSSFFWPVVRFDKETVSKKLIERYPTLKKLERIKDLVVERQSDYKINTDNQQSLMSRLTFIKLVGSSGKSDYIRAEDLRITIDPTGNRVKSTICKIKSTGEKWAFLAGRGWGHGVGMCQCGAQAMARIEGKTAFEILSYYYPGSEIDYVY